MNVLPRAGVSLVLVIVCGGAPGASGTGSAAPAATQSTVATPASPAGSPVAPPPGAPSAEEFARRLQAKYNGVRDFSADFVQTYRGGVLRKTATERGYVVIKKPGLMRWTYSSPEDKLFLADGVKMYMYVPADRQVIVRSMPATHTASSPVLFLVGKGNIVRDFRAEYAVVNGAPANTWTLKLTPRQPQKEYEWLALVVDPATLGLRMLVAQDGQGGTSTFSFANLKENVGVSDKVFSFRIPKGVDVITEG
jgi:outer membrane lipoprotein carrier protein